MENDTFTILLQIGQGVICAGMQFSVINNQSNLTMKNKVSGRMKANGELEIHLRQDL